VPDKASNSSLTLLPFGCGQMGLVKDNGCSGSTCQYKERNVPIASCISERGIGCEELVLAETGRSEK
jgi:hypothetical protein